MAIIKAALTDHYVRCKAYCRSIAKLSPDIIATRREEFIAQVDANWKCKAADVPVECKLCQGYAVNESRRHLHIDFHMALFDGQVSGRSINAFAK